MSTGTGTFADPIVAMSADPAQIVRDVLASLAHYGRTDGPYWTDKELSPAQFSNGLWHLGHNRYWEARMDPTNTGSADPNLGKLPALYWPTVIVPVPPVDPPLPDPPTAPPDETAAGVLKLVLAQLEALNARLTAIEQRLGNMDIPVPPPTFPVYTGTIRAPWPIGTQTITLTPTKGTP